MFHSGREMSLMAKTKAHDTSGPARQPTRKAGRIQAVFPATAAGENEVTFQTAEGKELQAWLTSLTRHMATFEADDFAAGLRASEVLANFKITARGRVIYFGRAVVSNVLHTGDTLLCEAKLDDLGAETAYFLPEADSDKNLPEAYETFFQAWQNNYCISSEFKVLVADVESYLTGVRQWLEQLEFGLKKPDDQAAQERTILETVAPKIIAAFNGQHQQFEEMIYVLPPEALGAHQDFVRRHWHKLFLCSPFGHRTYHKPIGYAGDYEMMNMIYRNQPEGGTLFEKLIHLLLVSQWPAKSVRNRVAYLRENILNETARAARAGKTVRILNVGCGPAREIQGFLRDSRLSNRADFMLIDFNEETLLHAGRKLVETKREFARSTQIRTEQISVYELLKRTQRRSADTEKFDLIYCAGLFDYLAPDTCRALLELWHDSLAAGGLMLVANMTDTKPFRHFIEFILDWQLIYRTSREFLSLVPERCRETTRVIAEPASVNLFLHTRKPD
jgi:extracellular factor (EF) 3-hydroxypalmitic acid methyl ester biosynthesis protein